MTEPFAFSLWPALGPLLAFLPLLVKLRLTLDRVGAAAARRVRAAGRHAEGTAQTRRHRLRRALELLDGVEAELTAPADDPGPADGGRPAVAATRRAARG